MQHSLLTIFASLAFLITSNHFCFARTATLARNNHGRADTTEKIKKKVEKIGVGGKVTVYKLDKQVFYGKVSKLEIVGFEIIEADTKQILNFEYSDLKEVIKGDGERNLFTGKRVHPRRGWLYGLAIFGTLFVILGIGLSDKNF